jgi:hypothetical protein
MKAKLTAKVFFKKYKVKKLIFLGQPTSVYEGINLLTQESVAMKFEKKNDLNLLEL